MSAELVDASIRVLTPESVRHAALVVTSHSTDVEDARFLLAALGIKTSDMSVDTHGTVGWIEHNSPKMRR